MNKKNAITEGEKLLLLVRRSGMTAADIAKMLNIHPGHLSKLFKSERLTSKIRKQSSSVFNVPESFFADDSTDDFPDVLIANEPDADYGDSPPEQMTVDELMRYLQVKDERHYIERGRLLSIIENLTKTK